jgi:hypothetical protein
VQGVDLNPVGRESVLACFAVRRAFWLSVLWLLSVGQPRGRQQESAGGCPAGATDGLVRWVR